ncbi:MAG: DNA repair protein RadC [Chlamydiia bacterium]|nr:DNA repair protein RadC [Chlamydiia bacterium]
MILKSLPAADLPRERLARYGAEALSTIELLAILLSSGTKNLSVLELAAHLLGHFGSLRKISEASIPELCAIKGIGSAKAVQLQAAFAVAKRLEERADQEKLDHPQKVFQLIGTDLRNQKIEVLLVLLRDVRGCLIHQEVISKGTLTELLMHPREVFHLAIRHRAHSVIIAHNHPSGDPTPSRQDIEMTRMLVEAGRIVGIDVADHLIIGGKTYVSLAEKGLMAQI